jgi:hypothetical protein
MWCDDHAHDRLDVAPTERRAFLLSRGYNYFTPTKRDPWSDPNPTDEPELIPTAASSALRLSCRLA